jgi:membrane-bound lytic murein transglycosylase B
MVAAVVKPGKSDVVALGQRQQALPAERVGVLGDRVHAPRLLLEILLANARRPGLTLLRTASREFSMVTARGIVSAAFTGFALLATLGGKADAAQCGSSAAGFEAWKREFSAEAPGKGVGANGIAALMQANYASATIAADRSQRSFGLSLDQFLAKRGATTIVARGRSLKQSQGALFASIQQRYGVPPGPLLAIWGMETGFGSQRGNQNMLSSIATLAYDCRRPEFFTEQLYAALKLVDRGVLSAGTRGSMHGEVGQTQFMPKNILAYGTGNLDVAANALNSTANFLRAHGWRAGAGYQPGEANFAAIQAWNAAGVYQKAIALMGRQIDGGEGAAER